MAENNSVNDSYNPPPVSSEFEEFNFEEIEIDDLIWISDNSLNGMENPAHRKIDESSAQNLKTGKLILLNSRKKVYQKT